MAIVRFDPGRELNSLQGEVNRLFNTFFDAPAPAGAAQRRWLPALDLVEEGDHFLLAMDLPGMDEKDIDIEVADDALVISGNRSTEREDEGAGWYRRERAHGTFTRSLQLPDGIDAEAIQADFDRGVLTVTVPKPEQRRPRKVNIGAANGRSEHNGGTIEGTATSGE